MHNSTLQSCQLHLHNINIGHYSSIVSVENAHGLIVAPGNVLISI